MRKSKKRGHSLAEVVVAAGLSTLAFLGAILLFVSGAASWMRGAGRIDAESTTNRAVRQISRELREAMAVTVDSNGLGLTYRLPSKDETGTFTSPVTWDGITRRIELDGSNLVMTSGQGNRLLCPNVSLVDPDSPNGSSYKIFTAGAGSITRSLNVMLASTGDTGYGSKANSRSRETIYLRNIPELVK